MDSRQRLVALLVLTGMGALGTVVGSQDGPAERTQSPAPDLQATVSVSTPRAEQLDHSHEPAADGRFAVDASVLMEGQAELDPKAAWLPGQVLVRASSRSALADVAGDLRGRVVHSAAVDGLGVIVLPEGMEVAEAQARLDDHPEVSASRGHGVVRAAHRGSRGDEPSTDVDHRDLQWHRDAVGTMPSSASRRSWVAVLDTGLAYASGYAQTAALGSVRFAQAKTLAKTPLVDPWDYLLQAPYPLDEHQHGTHITSLIASRGAVQGLARGAAVLPYKILDAHSQGTELALIDALYWTVWADADVVNLSLSFGDGYEPSDELLEALGYVDAAGLVMVAAAGNRAAVGSSWPAASPKVISVGASCLQGDGLGLAPYSNVGGDVDLLAPGGCLDRDVNEDGHPDGILAESFALNEPDQLGWFWFEGTSQAAALATAVVVRLLEEGAKASDVRAWLQLGAEPLESPMDGVGAGTLSLDGALAELEAGDLPAQDYSVVLLPWRADEGGATAPAARLFVVDASGQPADGVTVAGHFRGSTSSPFTCTTVAGACDVKGEATTEPEPGWTVTVGGVGSSGLRLPPTRAALVDAGTLGVMDDLAGHLAGSAAFAGGDAPVGWYHAGGTVDGLGNTAASLTFVGGSGIQTSPFGIIASPGLMQTLGTVTSEVVGSGIQTSPFGLLTVNLPSGDSLFAIEGSGIQTSPFGALPPAPGTVGCVGEASCSTTVVLGSGGTVGAVTGASVGSVLGASGGLELVGSCLESETLDLNGGTHALMHDAVEVSSE